MTNNGVTQQITGNLRFVKTWCFPDVIGFMCLFILLVVINLKTKDGREYAVRFLTGVLSENKNKKIIIRFTNLQSNSNGIQLFVNCMNAGRDNTELPIRDVLMGNFSVVSTIV